jgi:hypothetical protein
MPKISRDTASNRVALEGLDIRLEHFEGGYTACFETHDADADLEPFFQGLPNDKCQTPRWGYVIRGKVSFKFDDHEETFQQGEAYFVPPGHTPVHHAGSEIVEFSPTESLGATINVVMGNLKKAGLL